MNFVSDVKDAVFFKQHTILCQQRALNNFKSITSGMLMPYSDIKSNIQGFKHPIYHVAQLIRNTTKMIYGASLVVGSLITFNVSSLKDALSGLYMLSCATSIELLNASLAVASLATRMMATLFNLNYSSATTQQQGWDDEKTHRLAYSFI